MLTFIALHYLIIFTLYLIEKQFVENSAITKMYANEKMSAKQAS